MLPGSAGVLRPSCDYPRATFAVTIGLRSSDIHRLGIGSQFRPVAVMAVECHQRDGAADIVMCVFGIPAKLAKRFLEVLRGRRKPELMLFEQGTESKNLLFRCHALQLDGNEVNRYMEAKLPLAHFEARGQHNRRLVFLYAYTANGPFAVLFDDLFDYFPRPHPPAQDVDHV